jgi:hypothetical protein
MYYFENLSIFGIDLYQSFNHLHPLDALELCTNLLVIPLFGVQS